MFARFVAGLALLSVAPSAFGGGLRDNELIIGGSSGDADGLSVSGPSFYLRRNTPAVVVGMVRPPEKDRRYAYVLVIKGDEQRKFLARYDGTNGVSGPVANSRGFLEIAGKKVAFEYSIAVDPAGKQTPKEALSIDGKTVDLAEGRVVLVDLWAKGERWQQVRIGLSESPSLPTTTGQVESQAREMLDHLRRRSENVRRFLK
jgi:hypothetical protein